MASSLAKKLNPFYRISEDKYISNLLDQVSHLQEHNPDIQELAENLIRGVRAKKLRAMSIENFLQTYDLGSQEGLALMCLAEAYLRIPDIETQTALIKDKVGSVDWADNIGKADSLLVNLATLGL